METGEGRMGGDQGREQWQEGGGGKRKGGGGFWQVPELVAKPVLGPIPQTCHWGPQVSPAREVAPEPPPPPPGE